MIEGLIALKTLDELLPKPLYPTYPSGLQDSGNAVFRYSQKDSEHPNLMIVDAIYDNARNVIAPGYYELVLSDDRTNLVMVQSGKIIAVIPVFKIQEDKTEVDKIYDKKYQKKLAKKKKKKEKLDSQKTATGIPLQDTEEIYMNATIEYQKDGDYYLIKYERGWLRAWGVIKK